MNFRNLFQKGSSKQQGYGGATSRFTLFCVKMLFPRETLLIWYPTKALGRIRNARVCTQQRWARVPLVTVTQQELLQACFPHTEFSQYKWRITINQSKEILSHFGQNKVVQLLYSSVYWAIQQAYQLQASQSVHQGRCGIDTKKRTNWPSCHGKNP